MDTVKQAFIIPPRKIASFAALREEILSCKKSVHVTSLQRFQGELRVAVVGSSCYEALHWEFECHNCRLLGRKAGQVDGVTSRGNLSIFR